MPGNSFGGDGGKDGLAVAEMMVGRLMAHAGFACRLAHAEPVEPAIFDQGQARLQHLLAEIGVFRMAENFLPSRLTLSSRLSLTRHCQVRHNGKDGPHERDYPNRHRHQGRERPPLVLDRQRAAFLRDGPPSLAARRRDLMKLKNALLARKEEFVAALDDDFGQRARQETLLLDMGWVIPTIKYLHSNLRRFMRPERRSTAMVFFPGSNRVVYQPLGVVGVIRPELSGRSRSRRSSRDRRRQSRDAEAVSEFTPATSGAARRACWPTRFGPK